MNLQSIRIFLAIVENKSISGAARALHFTQPTVSEYLNQLERKLGVQLVVRERGARQVMLTPAGDAFIPLAQRWMELEEHVDHYIQSQQRKIFRLADSSAAHEYIISRIISGLMREMPSLEVRLLPVELREIPEASEKRSFDAALTFGNGEPNPLLTKVPFFQEERYILCPADTVLPDRLLTPEDLDPHYEVAYLPYKKHRGIAAWHEQHFPKDVQPHFQACIMMSIHHYLTDPRCWALLPSSTVMTLMDQNPGKLTMRRVTPVPPPRKANLLIAKTYPNADVIQAFFRCCGEYVDERPYLEKTLPEDVGNWEPTLLL